MKPIEKILLSMLACAMLLTGCNTMAGIGRDLQAGGKALESSTK